MAAPAAPSDLNLPAPTAAESANNPTRTIQYEYTHFLTRYRRDNLRYESLTQGTPYDIRMNANGPNFVCSRESFYLSLFHFGHVDRLGSTDRFRMCALQGIAGGAAADPVDAAIHGYSILINDLISTNQTAGSVIEFLKLDYENEMSEDGGTHYNRSKNNVLALLGGDYDALIACPQIMRREVLQYLFDVFSDEQRYIASSPTVKKAIAKYVITYRQPDMVGVYNGMTLNIKNNFFAFILNQTPQFIDSLKMSQMMKNYMIDRLNDNTSGLSVFLGTDECGYLYPNAAAAAAALVAAAAAAAAAIRNPFHQRREGAGGNQKRTLRKIKSKSIKSKSIKSKSYKKKINRKKSHRRYRHN